jgi:ribosome-associated protein
MKTPPARKRARPRAPRLNTTLTAVIAATLDKKGSNVTVLDLRAGSAFTDFFVIATANNVRQAQAIADAVQEALGKKGVKPALIEGYSRGEWILIDYFDFIVHVFTPATRAFYDLERLWGDATRIEVPAPGPAD